MEEFSYGEAQLQLEVGDRLLLFTDGASETTDQGDRVYGAERLLRDLDAAQTSSLEESLEVLMANLRRWQGSDALEDDVTLLAFEVTGEQDRRSDQENPT
jgi:sigma-B regulation protein RsbU (phosphoserine phosphatase)